MSLADTQRKQCIGVSLEKQVKLIIGATFRLLRLTLKFLKNVSLFSIITNNSSPHNSDKIF